MKSTTEDIYKERLNDLEGKLVNFQPLFDYIMETLHPDREQFVAYAVDHYNHLNEVNTSRLEASHARLKEVEIRLSIVGDVYHVALAFVKFSARRVGQIKERFDQDRRLTVVSPPPLGRVALQDIQLCLEDARTIALSSNQPLP